MGYATDTMVRIEKSGSVTTVILSRPERKNAVDKETATELADAFRAFDADDTANVAVLWGEGGTFCSGADLKSIAEGQVNRLEPEGDAPMGPTRLELSKPVIAAISGHAVAGGLELALWCDLRVAEDDAVFGVFSRRWGIPLLDGGSVRLPRRIGISRALDLILTGRAVDCTEAMAMGLINRVVPKGQSRSAAEALARQIAEFPQECMRADRVSAYRQFDFELPRALRNEFVRGVKAMSYAGADGAKRFSKGAGRHGSFQDFKERK